MGAINFRIPGPPRILIVDITNNSKDFEYRMSSELFCKLKQGGIDLASDDVVRPTTDDDYAAAFDRADLNFNTLLLVAHGAPDVSEAKASTVVIPGGRSNWYEIASLTSSLSDKLLCLAVCHGLCRDAIDAFVRGGQFALAVVAPTTTLAASEVVAFFPPFLTNLRDSSPESIDPNDIRHFVAERNRLASNKMEMFSEAVSC